MGAGSWDHIVGESKIFREAVTMAMSASVSDTTVLLLGETGSGKELFARAIHGSSRRGEHVLAALNCSTFSRELLEIALFGHEAGAFPGATEGKRGLIEDADGGSIFLDEVGAVEPDLQANLLRMLETGQFFRVGSKVARTADVRIISASSQDLRERLDKGQFREDLFYRLNVFSIRIPPLRDRERDITVLAKYFVRLFSDKLGKKIGDIDNSFWDSLEQHAWKGNVRELKNVIERAVIMSDGTRMSQKSLPAEWKILRHPFHVMPDFELAHVEKWHIQRVLEYTHGNKLKAAQLLKIGLTTVYRKMEEYGLEG